MSHVAIPLQHIAIAVAKSEDSTRLNKLEYMASEEERKKRVLEVTITHPTIDTNKTDLDKHAKDFFETQMKMERRSVDANLAARKVSRANTLLIRFSDRRYKAFVYSAKKELREENPQLTENLYVNDNLTTYNFKLLMDLKKMRKRRREEGKRTFEVVYSRDGKVFIKHDIRDPPTSSTHVKSREMLLSIEEKLEDSATNGGEPSSADY